MSTTLICDGFTTSGFLDGKKLCLTNYSASFRKNLMQSNAALKHGVSVNNLTRTKGPYIQDVPTISCEISFEPDETLFDTIISKIIDTRNSKFSVLLNDSSSDIDWLFDESYVESFSFGVSKDSILSMGMSFFVVPNTISYSWGNRKNIPLGETSLPIEKPIPYYDWKILQGDGKEMKDTLDFSFSFNQPITPKYSCSGTNEPIAPGASHLLFGLPTIEFGITSLMAKRDDLDLSKDNQGTNYNIKEDLDNDCLSFYIKDKFKFKLTGLTELEKTPSFDGTPSMKTTYSVHGVWKTK